MKEQDSIPENKKEPMEEKIFTDEFLKEIGFQRQVKELSSFSRPGQYGRAVDLRTNGMTILEWNNEGASCNYFGEALESNVYFGIKKDGGTRGAFNGYVFTQDDVRKLLSLTW
jgi:hypothetical protein